MPKFLINSVIFILVVTALWYSQQDKYANNIIIKSPNDQREYRSITLENDLTVMLISDPGTDKAAASLDVKVGSSDDPQKFLGLAHFLEHMLFLGTEKYPDADEYQKFISEHGGSHNAYTALQNTNYFFDVNANSLEGALDRFSQQFTSPLFNEDYVEREVNAVHSEFSSKIKDDGRRYFSVLKELLSPNHPFSKFSVGNLETLADKPDQSVREALLDFYEKHYSANQMKLVVLGKESLDDLEGLVADRFKNIPNRNLATKTIKEPFFPAGFLPAKASVQTIMDKRSMVVAFPVPSAFEHRHSQPLGYISNLIGHEGAGSLLSYLKEKELVNTLSAGSRFDTKEHTMLSISMGLTAKGLANQKLILEALFSYIELIKKEGIKKRYFDEQSAMLEISFKFQEKATPIHYVSRIAGALHDFGPESVLSDSYILNNFDETLYRAYLSKLTPDNMLVTISEKGIESDTKTAWYETPYKKESFSTALIKDLSKPITIDALKLPEENIFIPENTSFVTDKKATQPERVLQKAGLELWYSPDIEFGTPKANLFVTLRSPTANISARNANLTELMVSLIKDDLNEFSYPAYLAGLNYELYKHLRGVTIKVSGYSDKQAILMKNLLEGIKKDQFKPERFNIFKERLTRSLNNAKKKKPYEQTIAAAQRIILSPSWSEEERLKALRNIKIEDVNEFKSTFFNQLEVAILSSGNVTKEASIKIADHIESQLFENTIRTTVKRASVAKLTGEQDWFKQVLVEHPDTGFIYYLQGADKSFKERAAFMLLSQIISSDYYAQIRTEKQLGYIVFATNFSLLEQPALAFIVQSPTSDGPSLLAETVSFLDDYKNELQSLDADKFNQYKAAAISRLKEKDTNLYKRSNRYWREIDEENFDFNTRDKLIAEIEKTELEGLISRFNSIVDSKGNGLVVYSVNSDDEASSPENLTDIAQSRLSNF